MSESTVLVTGGTGFLGSYIVEDLVEQGHDVVAYDISTDDRILSKLGVADDVTIRRGDIAEATDVVRAVKETEATHIVHLAALLKLFSELGAGPLYPRLGPGQRKANLVGNLLLGVPLKIGHYERTTIHVRQFLRHRAQPGEHLLVHVVPAVVAR